MVWFSSVANAHCANLNHIREPVAAPRGKGIKGDALSIISTGFYNSSKIQCEKEWVRII